MRMRNKKANILTENIIFIILNLVFLTILVFFLLTKIGGVAVLEEKYSKEIALLIDSSEKGMEIHLNMEDAIDKAKGEKRNLGEVILIKDNVVTVQLGDKVGHSYSFFNDVSVNVIDNTNKGEYVFVVSENE
ncbi:MAG TPA: hypothetical protein ENI22_00315 [Candidatus Pacearchaeota archaeon]|nr:hypothetical protein [Candidatus Pacearchaeota archaeon]